MIVSEVNWVGIGILMAMLAASGIIAWIRLRVVEKEKNFFVRSAEQLREEAKTANDSREVMMLQHQDMVLALVRLGEEATVIPADPMAELKFGQTHFRVGNPMKLAELILREWEAKESMLWNCIKGYQGLIVEDDDGKVEEYHPHRDLEELQRRYDGLMTRCLRAEEAENDMLVRLTEKESRRA